MIGGTYDEAISALNPLGLTNVVVEKRFDEDISSGKIIQSRPPGGGRVDAGGSIILIISKGPERFTVPALVGLTPKAAQMEITKKPLKVGTTTLVYSTKIPKGFIITSNPKPGMALKRDTPINLVVSKGVETVPLTSYIGKSGEVALNELTNAGFNVESSFVFSETILAGAVGKRRPKRSFFAVFVDAPSGYFAGRTPSPGPTTPSRTPCSSTGSATRSCGPCPPRTGR